MRRWVIGALALAILLGSDALADDESRLRALDEQIAKEKAEIERLKRLIEEKNRQKGKDTAVRYNYVVKENAINISEPLTETEFINFCNNTTGYQADIEKLQSLGIEYSVIHSCAQEKGKLVDRFFMGWIEPLSEKEVVAQVKQQDIKKLDNTIAYYQDLKATLLNEIKYNSVDVVEQSGEIVSKTIGQYVPGELGPLYEAASDKGQKAISESLRKNIERGSQPIENKVADKVEEAIDIIEQIPGVDKISKHYLYQIFRNSPQLGRSIGDIGAVIKIYFRVKDIDKQLENLEQRRTKLIELYNSESIRQRVGAEEIQYIRPTREILGN